MIPARRRFIQRTLGVAGCVAAAVAAVAVVAVTSEYAYRTVAAYYARADARADAYDRYGDDADADARAADAADAADAPRRESGKRLLVVAVFSLAPLTIAGILFWTRHYLALADEEGSA
jgi:hypothetical protein